MHPTSKLTSFGHPYLEKVISSTANNRRHSFIKFVEGQTLYRNEMCMTTRGQQWCIALHHSENKYTQHKSIRFNI